MISEIVVRSVVSFLLLLTFSCSADSDLLKLTKIRLGVHNFPPGFVVSADGKQCGGEAIDRLNKIFVPSGYKIIPVCSTPARIYRQLDTGDVDLSISTITNKLVNKTHIFLRPAYTELVLVLYSHPVSAFAPEDNSVAAIRGFEYQGQRIQMQQRGFQFVDMPDAISAANFFLHKRSQYLISYQGPFLHYMQQHYPDTLKKLQAKQLSKTDAQLVVSARSVHSQTIIKIIQDYTTQQQCNYLTDCVRLP